MKALRALRRTFTFPKEPVKEKDPQKPITKIESIENFDLSIEQIPSISVYKGDVTERPEPITKKRSMKKFSTMKPDRTNKNINIVVDNKVPEREREPLVVIERTRSSTVVAERKLRRSTSLAPTKSSQLNSRGRGHSTADQSEKSDSALTLPTLNNITSKYKPFENSPHIDEFLQDPQSAKCITTFLQATRNTRMTDYYNFWMSITSFKKVKNHDFLVGKAWILFQKFVSINAYRMIDCFTMDQRKYIERKINAAMSEDSPIPIDSTIFDEMISLVEKVMEEELFNPLFCTKIYQDYSKKVVKKTKV